MDQEPPHFLEFLKHGSSGQGLYLLRERLRVPGHEYQIAEEMSSAGEWQAALAKPVGTRMDPI